MKIEPAAFKSKVSLPDQSDLVFALMSAPCVHVARSTHLTSTVNHSPPCRFLPKLFPRPQMQPRPTDR